MPDVCLHKYPLVEARSFETDRHTYEYADMSTLRESVENIWFGIQIMLSGITFIRLIIAFHLLFMQSSN